MIIWMLWSIAFATLIGVAAVALERVAVCFGVSRRQIWMVALVVAAIVPPILATQRRAANAVQATPVPVSSPVSVLDAALNVRAPRPASVPASSQSFPAAPIADAATPFPDRWALGAWLAASLMLAGFFARTMVRLRAQSVAWREADVESYRALVAPNAGPAVIGFTRPRIVIPEWALALDQSARELMLRHEMEHIRAHDPRTLLAAGALLVVFPWNVALWLIVRQLRRAMELDCDARVIRAVGSPSEYGRVLLAVGERYTTSLPLAAALSEPRPLLEQRIDAMTAPRPLRPLRAALPFLALALLVTVAATRAPHPAPLPPLVFARASAPAKVPPQVARDTAYVDRSLKPVRTRLDLQAGMHLKIDDTAQRPRVDSVPVAVKAVLDRERVVALARTNFPAVVRGDVHASFIVMLFDANDAFVSGFAGEGPVMIRVNGDTLTANQRRAVQQAASGGAASRGGSGRGGRGGGGTTSATGTARHNGYALGFGMTVRLGDSTTRPQPAPMNQADGLTPLTPNGDESGIIGLLATQVSHVDQFRFGDGDPGLQRVNILAVHLTRAADPSQVVQWEQQRLCSGALWTPLKCQTMTQSVEDTLGKKKAKVKQLVILPVPVPDSLKPLTMEACFDVAANGEGRLLTRTRTKDSVYDRKVGEGLRKYGFIPATVNGVAVRDTICVKAVAK